jgi:tRNA(Arg) A34 adenosine deaminase TadA
METKDQKYIRLAIQAARKAREHGNHPFGALLVSADGEILLEAQNTVVTEKDCTGHAETNLMRAASARYDPEFLARCTLYTSTEPCPMCSGAIYWGNVRRVVFGLGEKKLYEMLAPENEEVLLIPSREVFSRGRKEIEVTGPVLEAEAKEVHAGFW